MRGYLSTAETSIPWVLLGICLVAFGLAIPGLGFYWDDWPTLTIMHTQGLSGLWQYYQYDRPFLPWVYYLFYPLLGNSPIGWHIAALLLRWLTVLFSWKTLVAIWPGRVREAACMAVLFAVYPVFDQQAIALTYVPHWVSYFLFFLSLYFLLRALQCQSRNHCQTWLVLSVFLQAAHLWTMEYFLGLEIARLVIIFLVVRRSFQEFKERIWRSLFVSWPYLLVLAGYLLYRFYFLHFPGEVEPNALVLGSFWETPLGFARDFLEIVFLDLSFMLVGTWGRILSAEFILMKSLFFWGSVGISLAVAAAGYYYLVRIKEHDHDPEEVCFHRQAFTIGMAILFFGALPGWITGRQMTFGLYGDRIALPALLGASMVLVALLDWFSHRWRPKVLAVSVMLFLALLFHLQTGRAYQKSWQTQLSFFWQLYWRAPHILEGTPVLSEHEILPDMGLYSTASGIVTMYGTDNEPASMPYWFFTRERKFDHQLDRFQAGKDLRGSFRSMAFRGKSQQSLAVFYDGTRCLRILDEGRVENQVLPETYSGIIAASELGQIGAVSVDPDVMMPPGIFGPEPEQGWCYYYQKAELARQSGDWQEVAQLGDAVQAHGKRPYDPIEWIVFIEGYLGSGQSGKALELTGVVKQENPDYIPLICQVWRSMSASTDIDLECFPVEDE